MIDYMKASKDSVRRDVLLKRILEWDGVKKEENKKIIVLETISYVLTNMKSSEIEGEDKNEKMNRLIEKRFLEMCPKHLLNKKMYKFEDKISLENQFHEKSN